VELLESELLLLELLDSSTTASILRDFLWRDTSFNGGITCEVPEYYLLLIVFITVLAALLLFGQVAIAWGTAAGALRFLGLLVLAT